MLVIFHTDPFPNVSALSGDPDVLVQDLAVDAVMPEDRDRFALLALHVDAKETADDVQILVHVGAVLFVESARVLVGGRSAGILADAGAGV